MSWFFFKLFSLISLCILGCINGVDSFIHFFFFFWDSFVLILGIFFKVVLGGGGSWWIFVGGGGLYLWVVVAGYV